MKFLKLTIVFGVILLSSIALIFYRQKLQTGKENKNKITHEKCVDKKISTLYTKGNKIYRTDTHKEIILRGVLSDYFRYGLNFDTDFTKEGISGHIKRFNIVKQYGANVVGFYMSGLPQIKQNIGQLDTFISYAKANGVYVFLMPVSRDFEGIIYDMPQAQPYMAGNFDDLKELVDYLSFRYKNYPNVLYGMGAEPELRYESFETWNRKQIELALIIRRNNPNSILLVSSTSKTFDEFNNTPFPFNNVIYFGGGYTSENDEGARTQRVIINKRINTIVHQLESNKYPIIMGEFGGNYKEDFSSEIDLDITRKILNGINSRNLSFTAYNLSIIRADDPLTLIDKDSKLTKRGELFKNSFNLHCNN